MLVNIKGKSLVQMEEDQASWLFSWSFKVNQLFLAIVELNNRNIESCHIVLLATDISFSIYLQSTERARFLFQNHKGCVCISFSSCVLCLAGLWVSVPGRDDGDLLPRHWGQSSVQLDSGWRHADGRSPHLWKQRHQGNHSETKHLWTSCLLSEK